MHTAASPTQIAPHPPGDDAPVDTFRTERANRMQLRDYIQESQDRRLRASVAIHNKPPVADRPSLAARSVQRSPRTHARYVAAAQKKGPRAVLPPVPVPPTTPFNINTLQMDTDLPPVSPSSSRQMFGQMFSAESSFMSGDGGQGCA